MQRSSLRTDGWLAPRPERFPRKELARTLPISVLTEGNKKWLHWDPLTPLHISDAARSYTVVSVSGTWTEREKGRGEYIFYFFYYFLTITATTNDNERREEKKTRVRATEENDGEQKHGKDIFTHLTFHLPSSL